MSKRSALSCKCRLESLTVLARSFQRSVRCYGSGLSRRDESLCIFDGCLLQDAVSQIEDVAESAGLLYAFEGGLFDAFDRAEQYARDRESWRARLRQYQGARHQPVNERDGWLSLDEPDEYDFMACRWPVLGEDLVRGPPEAPAEGRASA